MAVEHRNALPAGYEFQGYRIEGVLGAGGFGITYKATDLGLNRLVAIKEYLPSDIATRDVDGTTVQPIASSSERDYRWGLSRFRQEAETLVNFRHPNIVSVYRFFEENQTAYMVMEYQDGENLATILEKAGALEESEIREILDPLLDGLEIVHSKNVWHRDIKPENIFIHRDGTPVLIDFGAARQSLSERSRTMTAIVSSGFAPFEQYQAKGNQGPWSDIYALGATLYRAMTGKRPPDAPDRVMGDEMVPLHGAARQRYGDALTAAVEAALRVNPEARPQSVAAFRAMLAGHEPQTVRVGAPNSPSQAATLRRESPPPRPDRAGSRPASVGRDDPWMDPAPRPRVPMMVGGGAVLLVAVVAAATFFALREKGGPDEPGTYLAHDVRAGEAITVAALEFVADDAAQVADLPLDFATHLRGGCFVRGLSAGHRLSWHDIGRCG